MSYYGDIRLGDTIDIKFTTRRFSSGAPFTLAGSPVISAYVGNGTTEITAGITLSVDFDSRTGLNNVRVVASSGNGFATATNVQLVITAGTVDSVSVVGEVVATFSIEARSALMPTTAGRTLDVSAAGEAGLDWANIGSPTTTQNLTGTTIKSSAQVTTGTAQAGGTASITLASGASSVDGTYDPSLVRLTGGTGSGQTRLVTQYVGSTRVATVDRDWRTAPDNTTVYEILSSANLISTNEGLAAGGGASTITLNATASAVDGSYVGETVQIRTGTGQDQSRVITGYVGATKVATVDAAWATNPDSTSGYMVWPLGRATVTSIVAGAITATSIASAALTATKFGASAIDAAALATDAVNEIRDAITAATLAELTGDPGATPTLAQSLMLTYMAQRNARLTTASTDVIKNSAGSTILTAAVSDDGTTFTKAKYA